MASGLRQWERSKTSSSSARVRKEQLQAELGATKKRLELQNENIALELELKHTQLDKEEEKKCAQQEFVAHEEYVFTITAAHNWLEEEPTIELVL